MNRIKNINRYRYNLLWMVEHFTYSKKANQLRIDLGNKLSEKISSEFRELVVMGKNTLLFR
ncbi:MAG: hypothetical protein CM15mP65_10050 [Crocinitomicaceae bacterium]|nr:MAG: hypothetical protein CM15mP65_10050 [Crocinitomicaceae bacterium]